MAKSRGQEFEDELRASIPEGVFVKKLHTPAPPPSQVDLIVDHLKRTRAPEWMAGVVSRSSHTPRQGFDMIVAARLGEFEVIREGTKYSGANALGAELRDIHGAPVLIEARPDLIFCLEVKSTQGKSFAFNRLQPHQEAALRKEALAGRIAGLVVEFSEVPPPWTQEELQVSAAPEGGDVLFLPILSYLAYKAEAERVSIPYAMAERIGLRIAIDVDRGRSRRYYKMADFLRAFGADIREPERRPAGPRGVVGPGKGTP